MDIQINTESKFPIYLQIIEKICSMVLSGALKANDKLPSVRELSIELGINPNTVARAYRDLQYREMISSKRGKGTFISDKFSALSPSEKKKFMENTAEKPILQSEGYGLVNRDLTETSGARNSSSVLRYESGKDNKFAVLAVRNKGHFHEDMHRSLVANLQKKGILPVSVNLEENMESMKRGLDEAMSLKPLSIILDGYSGKQVIDYLEANSKSFGSAIFIMDKPLCLSGKFKSQSVVSDFWFGSYMATKHLIGLGHKKIMLMSHRWDYSPEDFRLSVEYRFEEGYRMALKEAGLQDFEQHFYDIDSPDADNPDFLDLLKSKNRPTAIVSTEDFRITFKLGCFRKAGVRIPEDMSLIGYYNTPWSTATDVKLTTVSVNEETIAMKIAGILAGEDKSSEITVKPELVIRNSCGSIR